MKSLQQFPDGMNWYCVKTKPKKERMASEQLAAFHGLEVFCPQVRFRRNTARGPVWFQEAMFPGYMFARFEMREMKRTVSYAPGVLTIPVFNERYVPIPDAVIDALIEDLDENSTVDADMPLQVGDETTILEGSMRGLTVKVIKVLPAEGRVGVLLELLGTLVEAEFSSDALEHRNNRRVVDGA